MRKLFHRSTPSKNLDAKGFPVGLCVYAQPSSDTDVDLIFLHGLTGGRESTWTIEGEHRPWFETLLPQTCSSARIIAYGYDGNVTDYRTLVSENRIENHAKNLLSAIGQERSIEGINDRPIIFFAHSLGGLVCMDALIASNNSADDHLKAVLNSTLAIAFVGTPHSGSALAAWGEQIAKSLGIIKQTNSEIISVLRTESEVLARIQNDFHTMLRDRNQRGERRLEITCFYEELPLPVFGTIVPRNSAILSQYIAIGIHADHIGMTKFASREDPGYKSIVFEVNRWIKDHKSKSNGREPLKASTLFSNVYDINWKALREALDPTNDEYSVQHFLRCRTRLHGTAEWLFHVAVFRAWEASMNTGETLWVCGPPGCGKSVLAGSIIEHLQNAKDSNNTDVLYSYCTHSNKAASRCYALITTLVYHLAHLNLSFAEALCLTLKSHGIWNSGTLRDIIPCEAFWTITQQAIVKKLAIFGRIIWVIDGIDEVEDADQDLLIEIIFQIKKLMPAFRVAVLSRDEHDLRRRMSCLEPTKVEVTEESNQHDLQNFIAARVRAWGALGSPSLAQDVIDTLIGNAKGIFLWAKLIIDELEHLHDLEQVKPALTNLPTDMRELYSTIFKRISSRLSKEELPIFHGIINWVTFARKKLSLNQVAAALTHYGSFTADSLKQSIPRLCGSLVIIQDFGELSDDAGVRLLHASLTDYLSAGHSEYDATKPGRAHAIMARDCFEQFRKAAQCPLFYPIDFYYPYKFSSYEAGKLTGSWGANGPRIIDPESPGDESSKGYIIVPYIQTQYPLFFYASENFAYHLEQSTIEIEAAVSAAENLSNLVFDVNPATLILLSRLDLQVEKKKEIVKQLLAFSSALETSNIFLAGNIKDIAIQLSSDRVEGWLYRMGNIRSGYSAKKGLTTEKDLPDKTDLISNMQSPRLLSKETGSEDAFSVLKASLRRYSQTSLQQVDAAALNSCIEEIHLSLAAPNLNATHRHHTQWLAIQLCCFLKINNFAQELDKLFMVLDKVLVQGPDALETKAQMLFIIEDYKAAAKAFTGLVMEQPHRWDIKEILISTLQLDGQISQALQVLKSYHSNPIKTLDHWCLHAWIEKRRASLSLKVGRFEEHLAICDHAVDRYPEFMEFWEERHDALSRSEGMHAVLQNFEGAKEIPRLALAASNLLARYLLLNGYHEEALTEASTTILNFPNNYLANDILWHCWMRSPRPFRQTVFQKLKELASAPDPYWIAITFYAVACIQTGKFEDAVMSCQAAIAIPVSNGIPYYFAAKAYEALGKPTDALNILCSASPDKYNNSTNVYKYIAVLARKLQRWEDLVNALLHDKNNIMEMFTIKDDISLGFAYLRSGKYAECESMCRETLARSKLDETSSPPHDEPNAISTQNATKVDDAPNQERHLQGILGIALMLQNKTRESLSLFMACTNGSPQYWYMCGLFLLQIHMFSVASFCFDAGLQDSQDRHHDSQKIKFNYLEHRSCSCDWCKEFNYRGIGYICADCQDYCVCAACSDDACKDHEKAHTWLKCPSSAYPRLRIWEEKGVWKREVTSFNVELLWGLDIIKLGECQKSTLGLPT